MTVPSALERVRTYFADPKNWPFYDKRNDEALLQEIADVVEWFDQFPPRRCVPERVFASRFSGTPYGVAINGGEYQCAFMGLHKDVWPLLNPDG